ncbi:transcriptional regulator, LysR family protein [Roseobacter sp. SK209-2-6]|uniref:LysR substrate-binding domain-containing protein n=1 Tax=Roseobacter sp. SK209-2-6 TaxID=388739 RepID=UPI0000F3F541|nr:LysR substrate-binding domain-containing protein [Roseobacter sp. SK209-2-6]EBA14719.1 transcriptional regulator, LysR family protein [Roseobacter sp. SK209-2-6]
MRLPSLTHLRCFEAAARHQSFTSAGEELGLTQSAVSKKIKELETDLGFDLFQRVGRGVVLTSAGQGLAADLAQNLGALRNSLQKAVAAGAGKSALRIAVLPTFANRWLIPRLPDFFDQHPEIELNLLTRLEPFDFTRDPFDLAIHYGFDNWPGAQMSPLFGEQMVPIAAPAFLERHGLTDPGGLPHVPLLHLDSRSDAWGDWFKSAGISRQMRQDGRYFDQYSMVIAATIAGLGAAIVPIDMVAQELEAGILVQMQGPALVSNKRYFLVRPHGVASEPAQQFELWLRKQLRNLKRSAHEEME